MGLTVAPPHTELVVSLRRELDTRLFKGSLNGRVMGQGDCGLAIRRFGSDDPGEAHSALPSQLLRLPPEKTPGRPDLRAGNHRAA